MKNNPKNGWQLVCEKSSITNSWTSSVVNSKYISKKLPKEYNAKINYEILAVAVLIKQSEVYSEPCQISKTVCFVKTVNR